MNSDQPADAYWTPLETVDGVSGTKRTFESLTNAIIFVMTTLPDKVRPTAFIQTDARYYSFTAIEEIYLGADFLKA